MSYKPHDVVKVPFPFTDRRTRKNRPALVLSHAGFGEQSGHSLMAMITSAKHSAWPLDVPVKDLESAGLPVPCVIRMKLFTLDHRLVQARLGRLSNADSRQVRATLRRLLDL